MRILGRSHKVFLFISNRYSFIQRHLITGLSNMSNFDQRFIHCIFFLVDAQLHMQSCRRRTPSEKKSFCLFCQHIRAIIPDRSNQCVGFFFFFFFVIPASVQSLHFITFSSHFTENDGSAYRGCILFSFLLLSFVIEGNTRNVITWGNWEVIMISLEVNLQKKEAVGGGWGGASHFFNLIQM